MNEGRARLDRLDNAKVVLIPKKNTAEQIIDYRPISLLNGTIKIISKIWANQLARKLPELVDEYQTGSVKARSILDRIVTMHEVVHQLRKKEGDSFCIN